VTPTLVIIPTYNEAANIAWVVARVLDLQTPGYELEVLVVDDGSPDGTGDVVKALGSSRVHLLARPKKAGLGQAYLSGFAWGLERQYRLFVEMDGDGSHLPEQLDRLLAAISGGADLAIGCRWIPGGKVDNWSILRQALSKAGNRYARAALGFTLHDATAGYRAFTRSEHRRFEWILLSDRSGVASDSAKLKSRGSADYFRGANLWRLEDVAGDRG
jgi:dolichol-phosphate mannosyltransferase